MGAGLASSMTEIRSESSQSNTTIAQERMLRSSIQSTPPCMYAPEKRSTCWRAIPKDVVTIQEEPFRCQPGNCRCRRVWIVNLGIIEPQIVAEDNHKVGSRGIGLNTFGVSDEGCAIDKHCHSSHRSSSSCKHLLPRHPRFPEDWTKKRKKNRSTKPLFRGASKTN